MGKTIVAVLAFCLLPVLVHAQELGQNAPPEPGLASAMAFSGSALACSTQAQVLHVPASAAARAKVKARLMTLLRESLFDDAKGVVNIARENEIRKLANRLKKQQ